MSDDLTTLIAQIEEQEQHLVFPRFDEAEAWELGSLLVRLATERRLPVAIDIRRGEQQLFHAALPGATADNDAWIQRKVRVVYRFGASSFLVGRRLAAKGQTLGAELGVDPALFAAHGGAFPVRVSGAGVIGVVTVSGLPQAQDHALVVEALEQRIGSAAR
ncbi:heme-degrading domain-containing protein [Actinoplanes sp. NPDC023936]|uniref:heme-degrading domain-containing protein n=1 Tax=Actinoplanes sp. NPDC023936 TaxID=3154910 RepID=UPI0033C499FD